MKRLLLKSLILLSLSLPVFAAKVKITGIDVTQTKKYADRLEPRLQFISSRPASTWRADDAAFYLKRLFIRDGFPNADIQWSIKGNTIVLNVKTGTRYFYGEVRSREQTTLDEKTLTNYFYQPLVESEFKSIKRAPYIYEYTAKGVTNVENFLKSSGYWAAEVIDPKETLDKTSGRMNVLISVKQGPLHTLQTPQLTGISSNTQQEILVSCQPFIGMPATSANINAINSEVISHFRQTGYHFANVKMTAEHAAGKSLLTFTIKQGKRYRVRDLIVRGNNETQTRRIARHFKKLKKRSYDADEADKYTSKLLNSGVFKKVIVTAIPYDDGNLDLDIEVEEGKSVTTRTYAGIDSYEGLILGVSYSDLNLAGKMWRLNTRAEYTGRGLLGEVGITEPFFMGERITFTTRAFALRRNPDGYDKYELGLESSWNWRPNDVYSTRAYAGASYVSTSSSSMTSEELGPADYVNLRVGLVQSLDLRDDPILPTKGYNGQLLSEFGSITGSDSTQYIKFDLNNSYRQPINEKSYLISRFDVGLIKPANSANLPIDRRFFSGGTNSVRSFEELGLGPRSESGGDPLGGESYWVGSVEYVRKIAGPFNLAAFYDMGQVYTRARDLDFSNASHAAGLSARIHLPIGPLRFEYGYNLNRKKHEPKGTFHFTLGASF